MWLLLVLLIASLANAQVSYTTTYTGQLTFYGKGSDSGGKCSYQNPRVSLSNTLTTVAIGSFGNAEKCGTCILITPKGTGTGNSNFPTRAPFIAFVNNECPECGDNNIDLCEDGDGVWDITWKYVDCPSTGNIDLQLKTGSSIYWTEIQARNFKVAIKSIEYYINGNWVALTRKPYNYFDYTTQVTLPVQARFTSILGEQKTITIDSSNYNAIEPSIWTTSIQFTGSGSTPTAPVTPPKAPTAPVTPPTAPVTPPKAPTAPVTPPTAPVTPPKAPTAPVTPPKAPTAPVTPPTTPTAPKNPPGSSTNPKCTYGPNTNTWYVEFSCDQSPPSGVTVTCSDGKVYPCTLNYGTLYQCQVSGSTQCLTPRKAVVNNQCCPLDSGSCGSAAVVDESTSGSQNFNLPIGAIIGIVAAIIVILVVLVVIVAMKLRTPVMEQV
jgi:hypothetical protein